MALEEVLGLVANTGFPIVVASYLMVRMEGRLGDLSSAIQDLSQQIKSLE